MLTAYIDAAMRRAHYEILEDNPELPIFGSIPELRGVWANEATLEACREELQSALEDWILFSFQRSLPIPPINGIDLMRVPEPEEEAA